MQHRTSSMGLFVDFDAPSAKCLRSPVVSGLRTPPTCPASPLYAPCPSTPRSGASTPSRAPSRRTSTHCLPYAVDVPFSPTIVNSAYESNFTAAQCYAAYGLRTGLHAPPAPPLTGPATPDADILTLALGDISDFSSPASAAGSAVPSAPGSFVSASAGTSRLGPVALGFPEATAGSGSASRHPHLAPHHQTHFDRAEMSEMDFGLAACLATPMDPNPGATDAEAVTAGLRRLAQLPAAGTTTASAAARSAVSKLSSANDILQDASRYGDWARRVRRRRRLEVMQGALGVLTAGAGATAMGRLLDDCLLDTTSSSCAGAPRHGRSSGGGGGSRAASRGGSRGGFASGSKGGFSSGGGSAASASFGGAVAAAPMPVPVTSAAAAGGGMTLVASPAMAASPVAMEDAGFAGADSFAGDVGEAELMARLARLGQAGSGAGPAAAAGTGPGGSPSLEAVPEAGEEAFYEDGEDDFSFPFGGFRDDMAFVV
ncbi:hypothetical protein HYH03_006628 [Edaphochlamys debaryana]|uniref:Uncharacterized protein n=1 Tax=Edaphochlamys debaryana TaxID=47281 RepID=A0A835Y3J0_9CHLO|nr:hypothetical protein HYH03_006628 [Edaphochlamys debaryana]|eukprot:KAG2495360.1 hypothetical protein HYH03_006628 [Edaphochlamys debaryana]